MKTTVSDVLTDGEMYALSVDELMLRNACAICLGRIDAGPLGNALGMGSTWTIVHGVAEHRCGAMYRVLHYDESGCVAKPPECLVYVELLPLLRAYWKRYHTSFNPHDRDDEACANYDEWSKAHLSEMESLASIGAARLDSEAELRLSD